VGDCPPQAATIGYRVRLCQPNGGPLRRLPGAGVGLARPPSPTPVATRHDELTLVARAVRPAHGDKVFSIVVTAVFARSDVIPSRTRVGIGFKFHGSARSSRTQRSLASTAFASSRGAAQPSCIARTVCEIARAADSVANADKSTIFLDALGSSAPRATPTVAGTRGARGGPIAATSERRWYRATPR
jgi:hypothetical protein